MALHVAVIACVLIAAVTADTCPDTSTASMSCDSGYTAARFIINSETGSSNSLAYSVRTVPHVGSGGVTFTDCGLKFTNVDIIVELEHATSGKYFQLVSLTEDLKDIHGVAHEISPHCQDIFGCIFLGNDNFELIGGTPLTGHVSISSQTVALSTAQITYYPESYAREAKVQNIVIEACVQD